MSITFDDFQKLNLRVGTIKTADAVPGSDKLLKLIVDLGEEERQLVAGIAREYSPEQLPGKQIVVLTNLEPRTLMGVESNGMLLAGDVEGKPILLVPDKEIPSGTSIK